MQRAKSLMFQLFKLIPLHSKDYSKKGAGKRKQPVFAPSLYQISLFVLAITVTGNSYAQSDAILHEANSKMLEVYSLDYVNNTREANPALYDYLMATAVYTPLVIKGVEPKYEAQNNNSIKITKNKKEITLDSFYSDLQSDNFNLLNYSIKPGNTSRVFRISEGTYVIVESQNDVVQKYKSK